MSERDIIGRAIHEHDANASMSGFEWSTWDELSDDGRAVYDQVSADVAAALREARTVRTPEAARALPPDSVVMSSLGVIYQRGYSCEWIVDGEEWPHPHPLLPARVLYRPDEDGAR